MFSFDHFEYLPLIRHYRGLFGPESVHVFPYEALARDLDSFILKYQTRLKLTLGDGVALSMDRLNLSYGRPALILAKASNFFTYRDVADKRYLLHLPRLYESRKKLLNSLNRFAVFGRARGTEELLGEEIVWEVGIATENPIERCTRSSGWTWSPSDIRCEAPATTLWRTQLQSASRTPIGLEDTFGSPS